MLGGGDVQGAEALAARLPTAELVRRGQSIALQRIAALIGRPDLEPEEAASLRFAAKTLPDDPEQLGRLLDGLAAKAQERLGLRTTPTASGLDVLRRKVTHSSAAGPSAVEYTATRPPSEGRPRCDGQRLHPAVPAPTT